jgi:CRP/FNR family cyclic AMP-dependent transcriptional regulator
VIVSTEAEHGGEGMFDDENMMKHFRDGDIIIKEGESGTEMFIISSGKVAISKGVTTNLAILAEGDIFGEMALVDSRPRSATAKAIGAVMVRVLDRDSFKVLLGSNPKIAMLVFDKLCQRLRAVDDGLQQAMVRDSRVHSAINHITLRRGMV